MRAARSALLLLATTMLPGCMYGLLYTHKHEPLDTNFADTKVFPGPRQTAEDNIKHVSIPLSNVDLNFMWDSNAIGDIAKRQGIEDVHYADLETFSLVLGIWNQYTVHVYGTPAAATPPPP